MDARYRIADDLVIDRYYRGAILLIDGATYAVPEEAISVIEAIRRQDPQSLTEDAKTWRRQLVELGALERVG